jgi:outer membrane protein assembly factor BamB
MMMQGRRFRGGMEMPMVNMSQERWYPAPPAIVNGNVVFTAPDSNAVVCLSLRDGQRRWSVNRQQGDLYMGGVYNGKVLIVAKDSVRALKLSDGSLAWDRQRPIGMPSGQGVASNGKYYLPCKNGVDNQEPQIVEIDIDTGDAHATKSRKKEIPGNLIFYDGEVISQSIWKVSAYPQLHVKLAEMDARLKKNPNDPMGLTDRGELHLDKGELTAAVDDLKKALSFNPDADTRSRARLKLYDSLTELLQRDFNKGEEHLSLYKDLCLNEVSGDEKIKRQSAYLTILGKGRENQGKLVEAFDAYMEFGQLNGAKEMVPSVDEPGTLARPDVWARGRILAMIAKAKPEEKKPLEERVAKQWQEVKATDNVDKIKAFVQVFGSMFSAGLEARLTLAEKLTGSALPEDQRLAELHLDVLRRQRDDLSLAAQATETLAKFMVKKGLLRDAVLLYRTLGTEFKDVKLRDGRTGADVFNELVTDKRFLPYLETSGPIWGPGKMRGEQVTGPFNNMFNAYFNVDLDGEVMPYFQQHRLVIDTQTPSGNGLWQVRLIDRATGETKFSYSGLPPNNFIANQGFGGPGVVTTTGGGRFAQVRGHLLMLTMSHMVYVWDMTSLDKTKQPRPIIDVNLLGKGVNPQLQGSQGDADGTIWMLYADGSRLRVGQTGLLESSYVCLPTREGLVALDPSTGNVMWKREGASGAHLFGDAEYIFVVESGVDGAPTRTQVVRASDGVSVKVPDFSHLYDAKRRVAIVGRNLLVFDDDPKGGKALRLYDVLAGKEIWRQAFPEGSKVARAHDPGIAGVVQPDGTLTVVAADTGKPLVQVKDPDERIQAEHLSGATDLVLLQDRDSFYVALNKSPDNNVQSYPFVTNGLKAMRVHGTLYSYAKASGKLDWYRDDISNQYLVLENFDELPILIFGTMTQRVNRASGRVEAIEKKTGRLVFDKEVANNGQFHAMHADAKAGVVELQRYDLKIRFTQEGKSGADKSGDKPADAPQPAIRGGAMQIVPAMPAQMGRVQIRVQAVPVAPPPPPPPPPAPAPKDK